MYEVTIGFEGERTESTTVEDEKRGLELSNALMERTGGPRCWFPIRPDPDGGRLAIRIGGSGPIQSIRLRKATNGDASSTTTEPAPTPAPEPATTSPAEQPAKPGDGMH